MLDIRNGAWLGGLVRAHETLAALVKPDTRIVPANGRLLTGADIARHRDAAQEAARGHAPNAVRSVLIPRER